MITLTQRQVLQTTGITARQLLYFVDKGVVIPDVNNGVGKGKAREYSPENIAEIRLGVILRNMGITVEDAAKICTQFRDIRKEEKMDLSKYRFLITNDVDQVWLSDELPTADSINGTKALIIVKIVDLQPRL